MSIYTFDSLLLKVPKHPASASCAQKSPAPVTYATYWGFLRLMGVPNPYFSMKKLVVSAIFLLSLAVAHAQTFPSISGMTLEDKTISIPQQTQGKYTMVVMTYSAKASEQIAPWFDGLYEYFIMDPDYDMNLYVVPMISGAKSLIAGKIEKNLKKGIQEGYRKHFVLYQGNIEDYKKTLRMDNKDVPYMFLLDKTGKIIYQAAGNYSDAQLDKIEAKLPE